MCKSTVLHLLLAVLMAGPATMATDSETHVYRPVTVDELLAQVVGVEVPPHISVIHIRGGCCGEEVFYIIDPILIGEEVGDSDESPQQDSVTTKESTGSNLPATVELSQNYPNPFNPTTTISFSLPEAGTVRIEVFNVLGQRVRTLLDGELAAGLHSVVWDGRADNGFAVSSGVYFYRLSTGDVRQSRKMLLLK